MLLSDKLEIFATVMPKNNSLLKQQKDLTAFYDLNWHCNAEKSKV